MTGKGTRNDVCKGKGEGSIAMYFVDLIFIKRTVTYIKYFKGEWVMTRVWKWIVQLELEMWKHN